MRGAFTIHEKMIFPLLVNEKGTRWLTVGDGYYGLDANFLIKNEVQATASCLSAKVLQIAHQRGWINDWSCQNAQALSFADSSFDYSLCMEVLQHCEFPTVALDEALRVSKRGVLIMGCIRRENRILDRFRELMRRRVLGRQNVGIESYEPTGGPITRFDNELVENQARRAGFQVIATRRFNMLPLGRFWNRRANLTSPLYLAFRAGFILTDWLCELRLMSPSFAWFVLLRDQSDLTTIQCLRDAGFTLKFK